MIRAGKVPARKGKSAKQSEHVDRRVSANLSRLSSSDRKIFLARIELARAFKTMAPTIATRRRMRASRDVLGELHGTHPRWLADDARPACARTRAFAS
ncbi:MAG: hypothetical protein ACHQRJ_03810 [Alphaproteobacteria bacterium]